jgi:PAS domain S-box-containing protein
MAMQCHDTLDGPGSVAPGLASKLFMAVEQSPSIVIVADAAGRIEYVNPKYASVSGYSREEVMGKQLRQTSTTYLSEDEIARMYERLRSGQEWQGEFRNKRKDGSLYWVSSRISPLTNDAGVITHFIDVEEDVTERKQAEERLRASLKEKEVMLMEIHHRVKNNLQVISSLLSLQSSNVTNEHDLAVFRECQNQVRSMALIHEKMYRSADVAFIDFGNYVHSLAEYLLRTYAVRHRICANVLAEQVLIDANIAVPCGLIVNELITNCIKYAFPESGAGEINIEIWAEGEQVTLIVRDNGVGIPEDAEAKKNDTLGISLVYDLVRQIDGTVDVDSGDGTRFRIQFPNR